MTTDSDGARLQLSPEINDIGTRVLDAAFRVHRAFGPSVLESIYAKALVVALRREGLQVEREVWVPLEFEGERIENALRLDIVVEGRVIVEVKAVEAIHPVHKLQVISYLRLTGAPLGYLINFHVPRLETGIKRFANTAR